MFDLGGKRIWIAGHTGMVGRALARRLEREDCRLVLADRRALDLTRQAEVEAFVAAQRPDAIIVAAARVGGILANDREPVPFLLENLAIATNIFSAAHAANIGRLLYLGSSCIYPRDAAQPITEAALLTGPLEPTNQWYAVAKIAGVKLAEAYRRQFGRDYIAALPTNLYGPWDNFDPVRAHVLPALIAKADAARAQRWARLPVWGSGRPRREFLHVDDCAEALVLLLRSYSGDLPVNVGSGTDIAIADLARTICDTVGFDGEIVFDTSKPDGMARKLLDGAAMSALGWRPRIGLEDGIRQTYAWFQAQRAGAAA